MINYSITVLLVTAVTLACFPNYGQAHSTDDQMCNTTVQACEKDFALSVMTAGQLTCRDVHHLEFCVERAPCHETAQVKQQLESGIAKKLAAAHMQCAPANCSTGFHACATTFVLNVQSNKTAACKYASDFDSCLMAAPCPHAANEEKEIRDLVDAQLKKLGIPCDSHGNGQTKSTPSEIMVVLSVFSVALLLKYTQ